MRSSLDRRAYRRLLAASAATFASLLLALIAVDVTFADDFRIETKIYVGDTEEPVSETTTLFFDGVVYDFLESTGEIAVFKKPAGDKPGRFILLDAGNRTRTEFTTEQVSGAMKKLRSWAARQSDPFLEFAANPAFEESFDTESGQLVLASHLENYTVATSPAEHDESLAEYREFLDWYTQLNTLLTAGPPPEPRLQLNAALARHRVVPTKVELARTGESEPLRAEHQFTWLLSREDVERIDDVRASLAAYRSVPNEEYLQGSKSEQNLAD